MTLRGMILGTAAYRSTESGQGEIFVQSFPTPGGRVQVSSDGGIQPVWSRDGRRLYRRSPTEIMMARVISGTSFSVEPPQPLFKDSYGRPQGDTHTTYDVFPDGDFVFFEPVQTADPTSASPIVIAVFN